MTVDEGCARWVALADREAVGEPLTEAESAFVRDHETSCTSCSVEASMWRSLDGLLEAGDAPEPSSIEVERVLSAVGSQVSPPSAPRRASSRFPFPPHGRTIMAGALAASMAAAAVVFFLRKSSTPSAPVVSGSSAQVAVTSGRVTVNLQVAGAGMKLAAGDSVASQEGSVCLRIDPGVRLCLAGDSEVRMTELAAPSRRVDVVRGTAVAALDPQPVGWTFSLGARDGVATARGTAFSVSVGKTKTESAVLRVLHGRVGVSPAKSGAMVSPAKSGAMESPANSGRSETLVDAHQSMVIDSRSEGAVPRASDEALEQLDRRTLAPSEAWTGGASGSLAVTVREPSAWVSVDGLLLGRAPISALLSAGPHTLRVSSEGYAEREDSLAIAPDTHVIRDYSLAPATKVSPTAPTSAAVPSTATSSAHSPVPSSIPSSDDKSSAPTAAELLRSAQSLRAASRFREAAAAYQRLLSLYPLSAEARASLLSLGELQLAHLADAKGALSSFDAYLASGGGALRQEASHGRIRALRALGRRAEERRSIEAFLSAYPSAMQAASLRERLRGLDEKP